MISGRTSLFCIFGYPVEHTFSPGMHNAAFEKMKIDASYVPFAVHPENLSTAAKAIIPLGIRGLNITVPHKEMIISCLDELTEDAAMIGAVNTIEVRGKKLIGHNTDGRGFVRSLREESGEKLKNNTVLICGAGGAARAVGFNLALAGVRNIHFYDVDTSKAAALSRDVAARVGSRTGIVKAGELVQAASEANILINATPLGLKKDDKLPFPSAAIEKRHLVCDLVYNPPDTPLLKVAKAKGAATLRGIGMLLYQGVIAFEIWTRKKAPVEVMRMALIKQMKKRNK